MDSHDPNGKDDLGFAMPEPARVSRTRALLVALAIALVLAALFFVRWLPSHRARAALEAETKTRASAIPRVEVITPKVIASDRALSLPGTVSAVEETIVYARTSGYVRKWNVDLGDVVKEDQVLAELETPELDRQISQARAQLAQTEAGVVQAKANASFSQQNLVRQQQLKEQGLASQSELDKAKAQADVDAAGVTVATANVSAQRANVQRLIQVQEFAKVAAPFGGRVTTRMVERGALVNEGQTPLFKISATDPVRVFIQVPQDLAPSVHIGVGAKVKLREFPTRDFDGTVARAAGALDQQTRTMLTEVRVPNPKGELLSGMYAQVSLTLPTPHRVLEVPATAVLSDATGLRVAAVRSDNHVQLVPVTIERDNGPTIEIASGLDGTERLVKVPTAALADHTEVEVAP